MAPETAPKRPLHVPVVMVPRVVRLVLPAQVESAVFSTLLRASDVFRLAVVVEVTREVGTLTEMDLGAACRL